MKGDLRPSRTASGLMGLCVAVQIPLIFFPSSLELPVPLVILIVGSSWASLAAGLVAIHLYRSSLRREQLRRNEGAAISASAGAFYLYLRPFSTSGTLPVRCQLPSVVDRWIMGRFWDVELAISLAADQKATLVAVGESASAYGAAKISASDETWKQVVIDLARRAALIVVVPLPRPATLWEVRHVLADPELRRKCVLVMPPTRLLQRFTALLLPWRKTPGAMWRASIETLKDTGFELPPYDRRGGFVVCGDDSLHFLQSRLYRPKYVDELLGVVARVARDGQPGEKAIVELRSKEASYSNRRPLIDYLAFFAPMQALAGILIAVAFSSLIFQPFWTASGSMAPTLLAGDYFFGAKWSYGYSQYSFPVFPAFKGRILRSPPDRGDVAMFRLPSNPSQEWVMRVIGLPGERVEMRDGQVLIDGVAVPRQRLGQVDDFDVTGMNRPVDMFRETLPNGVSYDTLDRAPDGFGDTTGAYVVPEGHYFVLGDNRDNANDSRFDVGFVPEENLVGRASFRHLSIAGGGSAMAFWKWPRNARFGRFFTSVH